MIIKCPDCDGKHDDSYEVHKDSCLHKFHPNKHSTIRKLQRMTNKVQFIKINEHILQCPDCNCIFSIKFEKNDVISKKINTDFD